MIHPWRDHPWRDKSSENERADEVGIELCPFFKRGLRKPPRFRLCALKRNPRVAHQNPNLFPTVSDAAQKVGHIVVSCNIDGLAQQPLFVVAQIVTHPR